MSRSSALVLLILAIGAVHAADANPAPVPAPAPKPEKEAPKDKSALPEPGSVGKLAEEEKWTFEPPVERPDIFVDLELEMLERLKLDAMKTPDSPGPLIQNTPGNALDPTQTLEWARREAQRIESFLVMKRWDDAIKTSDTAIKQLQKIPDTEAVRKEIERLKGFKTQAEEAKIYEEAQAKFDALGLRIEGILWQPAGVDEVKNDRGEVVEKRQRGALAVIAGESRAHGVKDKVKDCEIINIDTNRVDFLFFYNRRQFEFARYVGEDVKKPTGAKGAAKPKAK